jgi:hypothetical protein
MEKKKMNGIERKECYIGCSAGDGEKKGGGFTKKKINFKKKNKDIIVENGEYFFFLIGKENLNNFY